MGLSFSYVSLPRQAHDITDNSECCSLVLSIRNDGGNSSKPLRCKLCQATFTSPENIVRHLMEQHRIVDLGNICNYMMIHRSEAGRQEAQKVQQMVAGIGRQALLSSLNSQPLAPGLAGLIKKEPVAAPSLSESGSPLAASVELTPSSASEQPLDFSSRKSCDSPIDLSVKPDAKTLPSSVSQQNVVPPLNNNVKEFDAMVMKKVSNGFMYVTNARFALHSEGGGGLTLPVNTHPPPTAAAGKSFYRCYLCTETFKKEEDREKHITKCHPKRLSDQDGVVGPAQNSPSTVATVSLNALLSGAMTHGKRKHPEENVTTPDEPSSSANMSPVNSSPGADGDGGSAKKKRNSYSDSPRKLQCEFCKRAFPWVSSLKRHLLTHTGQKPYKCPDCTVTFSTKSNRERHMVRKHNLNIQDAGVRQSMEQPWRCEECSSNQASATLLVCHYLESHPDAHPPEFVKRQAKNESVPAPVVNGGLGGSPSKQGGGDTGSVGSDLQSEDHSLYMDEDYDEEEDGEDVMNSFQPLKTELPVLSPAPREALLATLTQEDVLEGGEGTDDEASPPTLEAGAVASGGINPRRDNYNVDRIKRCWFCRLEFECRKHLVRHLKIHNIDYAYKCYLCDASYETRQESLDHTSSSHPEDWTLLGEKNGCSNIQEFSDQMETSVQSNLEKLGLDGRTEASPERGRGSGPTGPATVGGVVCESDYAQRKVFCSFCVKRFWSLQDLRRHMRSHTGERPFKCHICQKRFTLKHSMTRHIKKHGYMNNQEGSEEEDEEEEEDMDTSEQYTEGDEDHQSVLRPQSDLLNSLLGLESRQVDVLLTGNVASAAEMLGVQKVSPVK